MAIAASLITEKASSLAFSVICLESLTPVRIISSGMMTAAATTGPASGPRPASSTPATKPYPALLAIDS